jgi:hypothetical protein
MVKFIKCSDKKIAEQLKKQGLVEVPSTTENGWVFMNNGKVKFSETEKAKVIFTNKLCI